MPYLFTLGICVWAYDLKIGIGTSIEKVIGRLTNCAAPTDPLKFDILELYPIQFIGYISELIKAQSCTTRRDLLRGE